MAVNASAVPSRRPLRRSNKGRVIGGVCAGIGRRLRIDPVIVRVGFIAGAVSGGVGVLVYGLAWALIPMEGSGETVVDRVRL